MHAARRGVGIQSTRGAEETIPARSRPLTSAARNEWIDVHRAEYGNSQTPIPRSSARMDLRDYRAHAAGPKVSSRLTHSPIWFQLANVRLKPRHSAGIVGMWETEDVGRVGIEWYYTGRQSLEENPYRAVSDPYMILGLPAEKQFGWARLSVNGENLTGVRQTRWDPLLRTGRAADGRWTVDAWDPLERPQRQRGFRIRF
jgi:outer membrane receptor protein involved in Fe transport